MKDKCVEGKCVEMYEELQTHHLCSQHVGELTVHGIGESGLCPRPICALKSLLHFIQETKSSRALKLLQADRQLSI